MKFTDDSTRTVFELSLDEKDEINRRVHQAIGIVDLLGNADDGSKDNHSRNNASWAVQDLLKGIMTFTERSSAALKVVGMEGGAA